MSTRLQLLHMKKLHIPAVVEISRACQLPAWSADTFERELILDRRDYLIAISNGRVLGFGGMMYVLEDAHLTVIGVHPEARRSGIATVLLAKLLENAWRAKCSGATLEVRVDNRGAQSLYRRFGMTVDGVRPKYYEDGGDAAIMWHRAITDPGAVRLRRRLARLSRERWNEMSC